MTFIQSQGVPTLRFTGRLVTLNLTRWEDRPPPLVGFGAKDISIDELIDMPTCLKGTSIP